MTFTEKTRQHEMSATVEHEELISCCLHGNRQAWEEFFRRYTPLIKKAIIGKFKDHHDAESIRDTVFEQIVTDLLTGHLLEECRDLHGFSQWLATVSANRTISWLRANGRLKRLPEKSYNEGAVSLFEVLDQESGLTLIDLIPAPQKDDPNLIPETESALTALENLSNWKQKWLLRLSIAGQCPLTGEEWQALFSGSGCDHEAFDAYRAAIENDLTVKEKEKRKSAVRAEILWHQVYRLEAGLRECDAAERVSLENRIAQLRIARERHLHTLNRFVRPQYSLIAGILGMGEDKVEQISGLLARARKALAKKSRSG